MSLTLPSLCRSLAEGLQKDKAPGLPVFATALCCLPYVLPESWDATRLATELPGDFSPVPRVYMACDCRLQGVLRPGQQASAVMLDSWATSVVAAAQDTPYTQMLLCARRQLTSSGGP